MSEKRGHLEGRWVWYDLYTSDVTAAANFYGEVVGWKVNVMEGYSHITIEDEGVGGMAPLPEDDLPPHWMGYVCVDDVDAKVAQARELGGRVIMEPFDIGDSGRSAVLADPAGAAFALYSMPNSEKEKGWTPRAPQKIGAFIWHELYSESPDASWDFMSAMFGWEKSTAMEMGEMGVYQLFGLDGVDWGALMKKPESSPVSAWGYYITVDDTDAAATRVEQNGGTILMAPHDVPGGRILVATDPQGAMFALHAERAE